MKFEHTEVMNFEGAFRGMRNPMNSWAKSDSSFGIACEHENDETPVEIAYAWVDYELSECEEEASEETRELLYEEKLEWLYLNGYRFITQDHHYAANYIGPNDMKLARKLIAGGGEHRKFLRQIFVSVDITAPLYWWKEFDTYKVGTTANSTSTMHKLASTPITLDCFEIDDFEDIVFYSEYGSHDNLIFECTTKGMAEGMIKALEDLRQKYNETKDKRYWKELIRWLPESWLQTRTVTMNYENLRNMYHQREHHKLTEWHSFCHWVEGLPYAKELIID